LVEVLVVVAIMTLLVSITVPSLHRARKAARSTVCLTRLRGIHQAAMLYSFDHDEYLPPKFEIKKHTLSVKDIAEGLRLNTPEEGIQTVLGPYGSLYLFRCPSDRGSFEDPTPLWERRGESYEVKGVKPKDLTDPSKANFWGKMEAGEIVASDPFTPWDSADPAKVQEKIGKGEHGPISWHGAWYHIVLARGHAISVRTKEEERAAQGKY